MSSYVYKIYSMILHLCKEITKCFPLLTAKDSGGGLNKELLNEACKQVCSNDLILLEIFSHLPLQDLNNSRLVNIKWNALANSKIIMKNLWSIGALNVTWCTASFDKSQSSNPLQDFLACMKSSQQSLLTSITLRLTLDNFNIPLLYLFLQHQDITGLEDSFAVTESPSNSNSFCFVQFLKLFGKEIKIARIHIDYRNQDKLISHLILQLLPNLVHLEFIERDLTPEGILTQSLYQETAETAAAVNSTTGQLLSKAKIPLHLSQLKLIKYDFYRMYLDADFCRTFEIFPRILRSAPNLREIFNVHLDNLEYVEDAGKVQTVKECTLEFQKFAELLRSSAEGEERLERNCLRLNRFAKSYVQLEVLCFGIWNFEICVEAQNCFTTILHSSQDSLRKLSMPAFRFFPSILLPKLFPKLEYLSVDNVICNYEPGNYSLTFPKEYLLQEVFPFPSVRHFKFMHYCYMHYSCDHEQCQEVVTGLIASLHSFRSLQTFRMHSNPKMFRWE